jgi:hypothetical protein
MKSALSFAAVLALPLALVPALVCRASSTTEYPGEKEFASCKKLPAGKAVVKLNVKPDTEISDLIGWISTITCTPFLVPSTVSLEGRKVTVIAPREMTVSEAYHLFHAALDSVHLEVEPSGKFLRIVEAR